MQISHYTNFIYLFVGMIAVAGIFLSRTFGEGSSSFFNGGKSAFWVISALSMFAGSLVQFWILLIPVLSLSGSAVLILLSLFISMLLPMIVIKNRNAIIDRFIQMMSSTLKSTLYLVAILFFLIIQPFALLYLSEKIIAQLLGGSYHFLLVFLISTAGLCALIGGKKVVIYANAMFGIAVIVSMVEVMYLGRSFSAPLMFLQMLFTEGAQYFQRQNVFETNWIIGFIGFSVITWWMWWIENGAYHVHGKQSEQRNSNAAMFASFPLIVIALVVLPLQGRSESAALNGTASSSMLAGNELLVYSFVIGVVSVMVSAFSHSFHTIATIVATQFFHDEGQQHTGEKQILVARLVIVLSALLTILYIPFAQFLGAATLLVYVQYLACIAASIVGVFTVFVFWKNFYKSGITSGIYGGLFAGMVIMVLSYGGNGILSPMLSTPYGGATAIFFFAMLCSIVGSIFVERKVPKDSITV